MIINIQLKTSIPVSSRIIYHQQSSTVNHLIKVKLAKQKVTKVAQNLQASFSAAGIDLSPIKIISQSGIDDPKSCDDSDLNTLMHELKSKFQTSNRQQKIQILTMKPKSCTIEKLAKFLNTTKHSVQKAISFQKEEEICHCL